VVQAADLAFDATSWSPDSRYFAYWTFSSAESLTRHDEATGSLHFVDVSTGATCVSVAPSDIPWYPRFTRVMWTTEGHAELQDAEGTRRSVVPCLVDADGTPATGEAVADAATADVLAPGGRYRLIDDGCLNRRTSIVSVPDNQEQVALTWRAFDYEDAACGSPPEWLSPDTVLIPETIDHGPTLLFAADGELRDARDYFDLPDATLDPDKLEKQPRLYGHGVPMAHDQFAVVADEYNNENLPLRVLHGETGDVETLPFDHFISASPDGEWLAAWGGEDRAHQVHSAWIRRTADVGGTWVPLAGPPEGWRSAKWSPDSTRVAIGGPASVLVFAVPDGRRVGTWDLQPFDGEVDRGIWPGPWSPDGRYVVAHGLADKHGLFIIPVPTPLSETSR
jgi:hypothetical protein